MSSSETINQGLALLLRGYSHCDPDLLSDAERQKLIARAKTIITLGYSMLQKLEVEELSGRPG